VKSLNSSAIVRVGLVVCAIAAATSVHGAQPPDVVASDSFQNTAMGTSALTTVTPFNECNPHGCEPVGNANTAAGYHALNAVDTGGDNTAVGANALSLNLSFGNTAVGAQSLAANTMGEENTAVGWATLAVSTGSVNTAIGSEALERDTTGSFNTALGASALQVNTTGENNTALGANALSLSDSSSNNTAVGAAALNYDTSGSGNTATGQDALNANTSGSANVGVGVAALMLNTTGSSNNALGLSALQTNVSGSYNLALGDHAGYFTSGSNNVDIANHGVAGENNAIRIGTVGTQKTAFLAGVYGTPISGAAVVVSSTGQLGVVVSSERFKTDIAPIGGTTSKLDQLRPVTFHLKSDPQGPLQYGLIAEEVAKVYPDLVIRDENGRIDGVRYDELAPMLLNEMKRQTTEIQQLKLQMAEMQELKNQMQASMQPSRVHHVLVAVK
jgi:Chaperone of endosialidase